MNFRSLFLFAAFCMVLSFYHCKKQGTTAVFSIPDDYRKWDKPVKRVLDYEVPGHGKGARIIFGNTISFSPEIISENGRIKQVVMKKGTVIIKEVYNSKADIPEPGKGGNYRVLDIMVKDPDHPLSQDGWLYFVKSPEGKPQLIRGKLCHLCHIAANETHPYFDGNKEEAFRDYIFVPFHKK